jgi:hypothetical protein
MPGLTPGPGYSKLYVGDTQVFPAGGGGEFIGWGGEQLIEVDYSQATIISSDFPPAANVRAAPEGADGFTVSWDTFELSVDWTGGGFAPTLTPESSKKSAWIKMPVRLLRPAPYDTRSYLGASGGYTSGGLAANSSMTAGVVADGMLTAVNLPGAQLKATREGVVKSAQSQTAIAGMISTLNGQNPRIESAVLRTPWVQFSDPGGLGSPGLAAGTPVGGDPWPAMSPPAGDHTTIFQFAGGSYTVYGLSLEMATVLQTAPPANLLFDPGFARGTAFWLDGRYIGDSVAGTVRMSGSTGIAQFSRALAEDVFGARSVPIPVKAGPAFTAAVDAWNVSGNRLFSVGIQQLEGSDSQGWTNTAAYVQSTPAALSALPAQHISVTVPSLAPRTSHISIGVRLEGGTPAANDTVYMDIAGLWEGPDRPFSELINF